MKTGGAAPRESDSRLAFGAPLGPKNRLEELIRRWEQEAETFLRFEQDSPAAILQRCATDLATELELAEQEALTVQQAAEESGYSESHLYALVESGQVPNAGKRGAPRIRRSDLPRKPGSGASTPFQPRRADRDFADGLIEARNGVGVGGHGR